MITRLLVFANVLAFLWEIVVAGPSMIGIMGGGNFDRVLQDGALWPNAVLIGHEYWRILTSAFLHEGLLHIGVNMYSLWILGRFIEAAVGSPRMALIYFVSLIASGFGVVYLSSPANAMVPTLGASGAIFGIFGALFAIGLKLGPPGMQLVRQNVGILIVNLLFTFFVPGISWQAHVSGLIVGFLFTLLIYTPPRRVAPVVVDAHTGTHYETEYQTHHQPPHQ
ncbi:MAG TPA: rhomboid family intramembrane serine protease [Candidatus Acidoferrum sp.]|nr:rhomboid family intramembrane serine protease [Candidatus Acidoferrum sp.]